jgi:hypothetical protein
VTYIPRSSVPGESYRKGWHLFLLKHVSSSSELPTMSRRRPTAAGRRPSIVACSVLTCPGLLSSPREDLLLLGRAQSSHPVSLRMRFYCCEFIILTSLLTCSQVYLHFTLHVHPTSGDPASLRTGHVRISTWAIG